MLHIENIQNNRSQLYKDFTLENERIVIPMTTISNDEVIVVLQYENMPYRI